jgi:hypothetical protein
LVWGPQGPLTGVDILEIECLNRTGRIMLFWAIREEFTSDSTCEKKFWKNLILPKIVNGKNYAFQSSYDKIFFI